MVGMLEEEARKVRAGRSALRLMPVPLYAGLPAAAQLAAFEHAPRGYRKARPPASCVTQAVAYHASVQITACTAACRRLLTNVCWAQRVHWALNNKIKIRSDAKGKIRTEGLV